MTMQEKKFVKVKCADCENEQVVFLRPTTRISCQVCGATMAEPTGGRADLKGQVTEKLE